MPSSLSDVAVRATLATARQLRSIGIPLPEAEVQRIPKPFPSPADWRDHWIYFMMIDRFNNPAAPSQFAWDRATGERQGGTFEGVRQKLDYIQALGAGALWLTPVLRNRPSEPSNHGYGIVDFLEVEPRLGTQPERAEAELIRLIDEAHARGLYVIMDIVINHAGDVYAYKVNGEIKDIADWSGSPYTVFWRDENGAPRPEWTEAPDAPARGAALWPTDLRANLYLRRQGRGGPLHGDFESLKEFRTGSPIRFPTSRSGTGSSASTST